jgi:hypothetical protein
MVLIKVYYIVTIKNLKIALLLAKCKYKKLVYNLQFKSCKGNEDLRLVFQRRFQILSLKNLCIHAWVSFKELGFHYII